MSYNIKTSDGRLINIAYGEIDRRYAVSLIGDEVNNFGPSIAQTLMQMLENFSSDVPPDSNPYVNIDPVTNVSYDTSPITGQLWYDNVGKRLNVYDGEKWSSVTSNISGVSFDFSPSTDQNLNIGTSDLYWHTIYGTHLVLSTNRGGIEQYGPGYAHGDGDPALTVDGDILLGSTSKVTSPAVGRLLPSGNGLATIGSSDTAFDVIYSEKIILGNDAGFKHVGGGSYDKYIYPTSNNENVGKPAGVHLGDHLTPFESMSMLNLRTAKITALTIDGRGSIGVGEGVSIVPIKDRDVILGSSSKMFRTINVETINTKTLQNADGNEMVFVNDVKMSESNLSFYNRDTGVHFNNDRDQLMSYGNVSNSSFIMSYGTSYNSNGSHQFSASDTPAMLVEMKNDAAGPSLALKLSTNETIVAGEQITWGGKIVITKSGITMSVGDNDVIIQPTGTTIENLTVGNMNSSGSDGIITNGDILMNAGDAILMSTSFKEQSVSVLTPDPDEYTGPDYVNVISVDTVNTISHGSSVKSAMVDVGHEDIGFINMRVTPDSYYGEELNKIRINGNPILYSILNSVYPVGTVYENYTDSTNPTELLSWPSSVWNLLGAGRMLVGIYSGSGEMDTTYGNSVPDINNEVFDNNDPGRMGGSYKHKLNINEMPSHSHDLFYRTWSAGASDNNRNVIENDSDIKSGSYTSGKTGGTSAHENMPPYLTVYRWVRVS